MKNFLNNNWKIIIFTIFWTILVYLLIKVFTPEKNTSDLNNYKLDQIDKNLNELKIQQKKMTDSIMFYQKKIDSINNNISNIKIEKKQINNYYFDKKDKIENANYKQIDSLIRIKYNF